MINKDEIKVGDFVQLNEAWVMSGETTELYDINTNKKRLYRWPSIGDIVSVIEVCEDELRAEWGGTDWPVQFNECSKVEVKVIPPPAIESSKPKGILIDDTPQLTALRLAVNDAVRAGNSPELIRSVVGDQLFGILHFGGGNVDRFIQITDEIINESRQKTELGL